MEAVGSAASILQLLSTTVNSVQFILRFYKDIKDATEEMKQLASRTQILHQNLHYLHRVIDDEFKSEFDTTFSLDRRTLFASTLRAVHQSLGELEKRCSHLVERQGKDKHISQQLRWAIVGRHTAEKFASTLSSAEKNLGLLLQIMETHLLLQNQRSTHELARIIQRNNSCDGQHTTVCQNPRFQGKTAPAMYRTAIKGRGLDLRHRGVTWDWIYRWLSCVGIYISILSLFYQPTNNIISSTWFLFHFPLGLLQKGISLEIVISRLEWSWAEISIISGKIRFQNIVSGDSPLLQDCMWGKLNAVRHRLLTRQGSVHDMTPTGNTPLSCAVRSGNIELVEYLVDAGANVNAIDISHCSVLEFAIRICATDITRILLKHGADPETTNCLGQTLPMTIVKRENRIETLQILLCECPEAFRALDVNGGTTLHALAYDGTHEELDLLIRSGADVSHRDVYGQTAMHIAAALGRHQIVEELFDRIPTTLERNQLIRLKADNSESYFHSVVRGLGSVRTRESLAKTIACLFRLGAVDHPNADGLTAYDMAQISGDRELVDAFVMATQLS